jgi:pimeloyl-ACP methyl ester carboxylesterase
MTDPQQPTVVLVHGAFADASGFVGIFRELVTSGYDVVAPPNRCAAWPPTPPPSVRWSRPSTAPSCWSATPTAAP